MTARSRWPTFAFPCVINRIAADHQTDMTHPPTTLNTNPRLRIGIRRHQRTRETAARATVPTPAKIDDKRTCGGLFRMVNCMASVFRQAGLITSTIMAGSMTRSGHRSDPEGPETERASAFWIRNREAGLDRMWDCWRRISGESAQIRPRTRLEYSQADSSNQVG